jgi:hypothetical protein
MSELNKYHYIKLDTKRSPHISLQNIVAGETGNRIWISLYNDGEFVDLGEQDNGEFVYRVCLRVDSTLGTRRQDSAVDGSGITLIHDNTGNNGKANIRLSKDSFTAGMNRCRLEVYSTKWTLHDTLICSAEFQFVAAGNATGENAGNVYPSLIELENELAALKTSTESARDQAYTAAEQAEYEAGQASTEATLAGQKAALADAAAQAANAAASSANTAASSANSAASSANSAATTASEATEGALMAKEAANHAAETANTAASTLNTMLANIDNTPMADSNNLVKSGGVYIEIQSVRAGIPFSQVPLSSSSWSGNVYHAYVDRDADAFATQAQNYRLVCVIPDPDRNWITLCEYFRNGDNSYFAFRSAKNEAGYYYIASIDGDGNFDAYIIREQIPVSASVSNGTVTFKDNLNTTLFSFALPVYNGGVS